MNDPVSPAEWANRLVKEKQDLALKIERLTSFVTGNPDFAKLNTENQRLLWQQLDAMKDYHSILVQRVRAGNKCE